MYKFKDLEEQEMIVELIEPRTFGAFPTEQAVNITVTESKFYGSDVSTAIINIPVSEIDSMIAALQEMKSKVQHT